MSAARSVFRVFSFLGLVYLVSLVWHTGEADASGGGYL